MPEKLTHARAAGVLREDACRLPHGAGRGGRGRRQEDPPPRPGAEIRQETARTARTRSFTRIWPFRLYGLGRPGLEEARAAYAARHNHLDCGWGYDGNCAALLGLTDEAARILKVKCANSHPAYRWPATWGPNFDWLPDQNHGGNLLETTQLMLLQSVGDKILLLPAWPKRLGRELQVARPAEHGRRVRLPSRQDRAAGRLARIAAQRISSCRESEMPGI